MRLNYADGFFPSEREDIRRLIFSNVLVAVKIVATERQDQTLHYQNDCSYVSFCTWAEEDLLTLLCCRSAKKLYYALTIPTVMISSHQHT